MKPHHTLLATFFLSACGVSAGNPTTPTGKAWIDQRFPAGGTGGTTITLRGREFGEKPGSLALSGEGILPLSWSDTEITFQLPARAETTCAAVDVVPESGEQSNRVPLVAGNRGLWIPTSEVPISRTGHSAIWTGQEMIIWGGGTNTGSRYNPRSDSWMATSTPGIVSNSLGQPGELHWTGRNAIGLQPQILDGGSHFVIVEYDPYRDEWNYQKLGAGFGGAPLAFHPTLWLDDSLAILGLQQCLDTICRPAAMRYLPKSKELIDLPFPPGIQLHGASMVWTGREILLYAAGEAFRISPSAATWSSIKAPPLSARGYSLSAWSGKEWLLYGGILEGGTAEKPQAIFGDAALYNPQTNTWRTVPTESSPGRLATSWHGEEKIAQAVWSGKAFIVLGMQHEEEATSLNAAAYDPKKGQWESFGQVPMPSKGNLSAIWADDKLLVWGNVTGAAYSPATKQWSKLADRAYEPLDRLFSTATWTGKELIVWGGTTHSGQLLGDGARFNPATDTWLPVSNAGAPSPRHKHSAVWSGGEMIIWGGGEEARRECVGPPSTSCSHLYLPPLSDGSAYDPASDTWRALPSSDAPAARSGHTAVWTGEKMIVWGGQSVPSYSGQVSGALATGASYDPRSNKWAPISPLGAPSPRAYHSASWTGSEMIIWGGSASLQNTYQPSETSYLVDGARYSPETDQWQPVNAVGAPAVLPNVGVWMDGKLAVWGEHPFSKDSPFYEGGGIYDPVQDSWEHLPPVHLGNLPGLHHNPAVWTGNELLVFASRPEQNQAFSGMRYAPHSKTWQPIEPGCSSFEDLTHFQDSGHAVWTGSEVLFFNGFYGTWRYVP